MKYGRRKNRADKYDLVAAARQDQTSAALARKAAGATEASPAGTCYSKARTRSRSLKKPMGHLSPAQARRTKEGG